MEGKLEYTSLLYIPKRAPFDLWNREAPRGLKLYVQRVFIMDEADQFLPLYLRFVRGVVDSSDLPLNVSREILQKDDRIRTIRNALTKRVLDMLGKMDADDYANIWDEFGQVLKEGIGEDFANKDDILGLLRFASTASDDPDYAAHVAQGLHRSQGEGGCRQGVLPDGRIGRGGPFQPALGGVPRPRHRSAAFERPRRRVVDVLRRRLRRQVLPGCRPRRTRSRRTGGGQGAGRAGGGRR